MQKQPKDGPIAMRFYLYFAVDGLNFDALKFLFCSSVVAATFAA